MRIALLLAALVLAPLAAPTQPAAAQCGPVPVFPGSRPLDVSEVSGPGGVGQGYFATDEALVYVQSFYYSRMPNEGWAPVTPLPGQHPEQHANPGFSPNSITPQPVLEFSRGNSFVRIVGEAGGYRIVLECR
jgi:hypothetical protein